MSHRRAFLLLIGLLALASRPTIAQEAQVPVASGEIKQDFARILFSWPDRTSLSAAMNGRTIKVTFGRAAHPDLSGIAATLNPYIESARMADAHTAIITLRHPYPIRTFVSSTSSGIDLLQIHSPRFAQAEPSENESPKPAPAKIAPVAAKKPAPRPPVAKVTPVKTPAQTPRASAVAAAPKSLAAAVPKIVAASPPLAAGDPAGRPSAPPKPDVSPPRRADALGRMLIGVEKKKAATDFHFPWNERVAAAAFTQGQDGWIVFNRPAAFDLSTLKSILPADVLSVESLPRSDATILHLTLNEPESFIVTKLANSYEWTISLSRHASVPATPIIAQTEGAPPAKRSIFLPVLEMAEPVDFVHPGNGEQLTVVPVYPPSQAVYPGRRFVDADVLKTGQGIAVEHLSSDLQVSKQRNGIRLETPDGVQISDNLPPIDAAAVAAAEGNAQTHFPYAEWKVGNEADFTTHEQQLRQQISEAPDPQVSRLRTKLADLYLGEGMSFEALGVLNLIKATDPIYYSDAQLAALRGAANFLTSRIDEAAYDFADNSLDNDEEMEYWRRIAAVMRGAETKPIRFEEFHKRFEKYYPPEMRRRLALIAADQAIGVKDYPLAVHIMDDLHEAGIDEPVEEYREFMLGRIAAESDQVKPAEQILRQLLEKTNDRSIEARAAFTLAVTRYKAGEIDKAELIKELDQLRIVWRGDQFEVTLLDLLGDLYVSEKRYLDGLRAWKELVTRFPSLPSAIEIQGKMADTFVKLFNGGGADDLTPVEALGVFYEFIDLTPLGKEGDQMIQGLADRLAAVDLLDRAAALLEHQIAYRLEKDERSKVGARLALLYLLNKEPKEAIKVLEVTGYGNNPTDLQLQRLHLAAQAYAMAGDPKTAIGLLKDDFSIEGKQIKLDTFWDQKDWPDVVAIAEDMLAGRKNITAPLTETESQVLLRLAIAYTFQDDALQLQYLRDYFTPLMATSPNKAAFEFITSDTAPLDMKNIGKISDDMTKMRSFLDGYKSSVKKGNLSGTVK